MPSKEIYEKWRSEGKCPHCGRELSDKEFKTCSLCRAEHQTWRKERFRKNPLLLKESIAKFSKYVTEERNKTRAKIIELLGSKCVRCGFSDIRALDIDHVKGHGCAERRKYNPLQYYRFVLSKILERSEDYQVLCCNCNRIKIIENRELHS